jgi:hypothetical protein
VHGVIACVLSAHLLVALVCFLDLHPFKMPNLQPDAHQDWLHLPVLFSWIRRLHVPTVAASVAACAGCRRAAKLW